MIKSPKDRFTEIRERHKPMDGGVWCIAGCDEPWPCDVAKMFDLLDDLSAAASDGEIVEYGTVTISFPDLVTVDGFTFDRCSILEGWKLARAWALAVLVSRTDFPLEIVNQRIEGLDGPINGTLDGPG